MPVLLHGTCPVHGDFQTPPERSTCPTCLTQAALYRQIEMDGVEGITQEGYVMAKCPVHGMYSVLKTPDEPCVCPKCEPENIQGDVQVKCSSPMELPAKEHWEKEVYSEEHDVKATTCVKCGSTQNVLPMFNLCEACYLAAKNNGFMQKHEFDPTGVEAHEPGAKLDGGKLLAATLSDFSLALQAVAEVGTHGARKYSRGGWQSVPDALTRYKDAEWRHLLKSRHEEYDQDSGLLHDAHKAWNVLAQLELRLRKDKSYCPVTEAARIQDIMDIPTTKKTWGE